MTAQDFISFLYSQTTGIGLSTYSQLSSNSQTSAYTFSMGGSELEVVPESGTLNYDFRVFSGGDPGWLQHITPADLDFDSTHWNADFRYIITPETTLGIIYNYDMNNKCCCPYRATTYFQNYFSRFTSNIIVKENGDANNGRAFLTDLENGFRNYRCVMVWEFSHGGHESISIGASYTDIGKKLEMAGGMVFMMFDSCHSESMIYYEKIKGHNRYLRDTYYPGSKTEPGIEPEGWDIRKSGLPLLKSSSNIEENDDFARGIIEHLEHAFSNGERRITGAMPPTIKETDSPIVMLWSTTGASTYGWYMPKSSTDFAESFKKVIGGQENHRFVDKDITQGLWPKVRDETKSHWNSKDPTDRCRPCMRTFEPSDNFNKFVYLFCTR